MPTGISLRDPVLINTIGHTAGMLLFGVIIWLLIRDRRTHGMRTTSLPISAAVLALAWNVGSLIATGYPNPNSVFIEVVMALSFSVLSMLPAILLHLAVKGQQTTLQWIGYGISGCAVGLHLSELFTTNTMPHQAALLIIAFGFGGLTVAAYWERRRKAKQGAEFFPLACLLLFTSSFPHFGYTHVGSPWAAEITWHHIGIPVVLVVLLSDYRFLLLDTYIRFLVNAALASGYIGGVLFLSDRLRVWPHVQANRFETGLVLAGLCLSLVLFAHALNAVQRWVGRVIFRRQNVEGRIEAIGQLWKSARSEEELLNKAAQEVAAHLRTGEFGLLAGTRERVGLHSPAVLFTGGLPGEGRIPLCFSSGEIRYLVTGSRAGGQRYLSEDLEDMRRLGAAIVEQVERFRSEELKRLATKAELRALQAQINPHFLFNALNALYGSIDRKSQEARRMVVNLSELLRYFLQGDRSLIPLAEEVRIIEAYLEIEALRLGDRLQTELAISEEARAVLIPMLSIQPIVENAVKHGIAAQAEPGRVSVRADLFEGKLRVNVEDTGCGFDKARTRESNGSGTGLENVGRRLELAYGPDAAVHIQSSSEGSTVWFEIPVVEEIREDLVSSAYINR